MECAPGRWCSRTVLRRVCAPARGRDGRPGGLAGRVGLAGGRGCRAVWPGFGALSFAIEEAGSVGRKRLTVFNKRWIGPIGGVTGVLVLLALASQSGGLWREETTFHKGITLGVFTVEPVSRSYRDELLQIRAQGANRLSLPVYWSQRDVHATEIQPYAATGFLQTDYDAQIRVIVEEAHALGLRVFLLPIVQLERVDSRQWRGTIEPVDWDLWFESYERFILHYARLAAEEGVDLLSVGSELSSTEGFRDRWVQLIGRVRAVYGGTLTYSANWDHFRQVSFWDQVDMLGLSGYYQLSSEIPATYPVLYETWQAIRRDLLSWQQTEGKPLLFTELGYPSRANAARSPWDYTARGYPDLHLQRLCFRAFIETWKDTPALAGVYLWIWESDKGGRTDTGYAWRGKPAEAEIETWYQNL